MAVWVCSGIESHDRAALEHLLRYCARPSFSMERLRKEGAVLVYRCAKHAPPRHVAHFMWAVQIARINKVFPQMYPMCGGRMRLIEFITEDMQTRLILDHIGVDSEPLNISKARGPPLKDDCEG
jgi:hypothetical protein